jgi:hypothetical protein
VPSRKPNAVARASACGPWEAIEQIQQRFAQLVQAREREFHLRLDAGDVQGATVRCRCLDVLQHCALADAGRTAQDENAVTAQTR